MKSLSRQETAETLRAHGLDSPSGPAFAFRDRGRNIFYDWHAHAYHQLILCDRQHSQIETARGRHWLPRGRAAWIPAGALHRTLIADFDGVSIFFAPEALPAGDGRVRILPVSALMREMILHAARWPRDAAETDPLAASFFHTLALLCRGWLAEELPLFLPGATDPALVRAMDEAAADPAGATLDRAILTAGMSERSFRRHFEKQTGMAWRDWLMQARNLSAMALLAEGRRVTDVAADVGYASLSAFAAAFTRMTGEAPGAFRKRHADG